MLKDNRLLIGLGIGLIIGAILLELMNVAITGVNQDTGMNDDILNETYSIDQLRAIANSLDYNIIEKSVEYYTQDELDKAVAEVEKATSIANLDIDAAPVVKEPAVKEPVVEDSDQKDIVKETTSYRVRIEKGMVTAGVSQLLLSVGLISDVDTFEKELSRRKLTQTIQAGSFEFDKKPTLTELINTITTQ